jgi:hypothetical protein
MFCVGRKKIGIKGVFSLFFAFNPTIWKQFSPLFVRIRKKEKQER